MSPGHVIFAVSDSRGETAEHAVRASLAQFGTDHQTRIEVIGNVQDEDALTEVVDKAQELGALIVYTLVVPELRRSMATLAQERCVAAVDLLGSLIWELSSHLGLSPVELRSVRYDTDLEYFRRIEAVEFTVHNDDGRVPANLVQADIIFLGVSRTSKTPLSNYIAHRGYKVANVPLVHGLPPPKQLEAVDPQRVFGLVVDPLVLVGIRRARMTAMGMEPEADYGNLHHVRQEMLWARRIFRDHPGWTIVDITRRAVEETAAMVLAAYRERFERPGAPAHVPPPVPPAAPAPRDVARGTEASK